MTTLHPCLHSPVCITSAQVHIPHCTAQHHTTQITHTHIIVHHTQHTTPQPPAPRHPTTPRTSAHHTQHTTHKHTHTSASGVLQLWYDKSRETVSCLQHYHT